MVEHEWMDRPTDGFVHGQIKDPQGSGLTVVDVPKERFCLAQAAQIHRNACEGLMLDGLVIELL